MNEDGGMVCLFSILVIGLICYGLYRLCKWADNGFGGDWSGSWGGKVSGGWQRRPLPQAESDNEHTITNPQDVPIVQALKDCMIYGETTLPSGRKVPPPRPGYRWRVNDCTFVEEQVPDGDIG